MSTKPPFSRGQSTELTAILLFIETRQAVDPNGMRCVQGRSAGGADGRPLQQVCCSPGSTTFGTLAERRIVLGKLRELKKAGTKRTAPARDTVAVGRAVSRQAPAGPQVEVVLVGEAPVARGEPGRKDEVTKLGRTRREYNWPSRTIASLEKGRTPRCGRHELEGLCDSGPRQGICRRVRPTKRVSGSQMTSSMSWPEDFVRDQGPDDGFRTMRACWHEHGCRDHVGNLWLEHRPIGAQRRQSPNVCCGA